MKTALAGLNPGATPPNSNASAKTEAANAQDTPPFDRLMEKKASPVKPASSNDKAAKESVAEAEETTTGKPGKTERATRKPKAAEDWLPISLVSQLPVPTEMAMPASPLQVAADALTQALAAAGAGEAPAAPGGEAASIQLTTEAAAPAGIAIDLAGISTDASTADTLTPDALITDLSSGTEPQAAQAARTEGGNAAKPALQNLLSFASHLAAGNAAAAAPEAVALVKDVVDALRSDGDAEAASPSTNLMASPATTSANGLARTATVNPLEAPMPDLHNEQFDEAVGTRLTWMAEQKIGHAHIKISPSDLGTVEVRLRLDGDRVHADFSSAQPEVRQALENSLPKLRDMLGQHGFQLGQADVGHHQNSRSSPDTGVAAGHGGGEDSGSAGDALLPRPVRVTAHGLLDAYA